MNQQKLKIAVQIFGHLRTFEKCAPKLKKHLLDHYDCDIFMHTWNKIDHNTQTWHNYKVSGKDLSPEKLKEIVLSNYSIIDMKMEEQKPVDLGVFKSLHFQISIFGIKSMLYSMYESNKLREEYQKKTNTEYDFVLMIRPDILLEEDFNIESFFDRLTEHDINNGVFSVGKSITPILNDLRFVGGIDVLFFSKPNIMTKILDSYDNIISDVQQDNEVKQFGAEYLFSQHVIKQGFSFYFIDYQIDDKCKILRKASKKSFLRAIRFQFNIRKKYIALILMPLMPKILNLNLRIGDYNFYLIIGSFNLKH